MKADFDRSCSAYSLVFDWWVIDQFFLINHINCKSKEDKTQPFDRVFCLTKVYVDKCIQMQILSTWKIFAEKSADFNGCNQIP